ncbi:MAG: hypothetical protein ACREQW_05925 [Candidatus Binatia bacterium]
MFSGQAVFSANISNVYASSPVCYDLMFLEWRVTEMNLPKEIPYSEESEETRLKNQFAVVRAQL